MLLNKAVGALPTKVGILIVSGFTTSCIYLLYTAPYVLGGLDMAIKTGIQRHVASSSMIGGRLPKQVQRVLLMCLGALLLSVLFFRGGPSRPSLQPPQITHVAFPKKIWQTWMVGPLAFEEREATRVRTWMTKNPGYRHEVLTDENALAYVQEHFGPRGLNRPDILEVYQELNIKIIKADFLRYLVMYVEGGVYADIDVEALKPVDKFIPPDVDLADIDLVIGVEVDEPSFDFHKILGPKCKSFCQWTFMSKPGSPAILRLINNVIMWLNALSKAQSVPIANVTVNFDDVIKGTGPTAFTAAVLAEMAAQTGHAIDWNMFHHMDTPVQVANILVLTIDAFAAGQEHSHSGDHSSEAAMVKHHYHATGWAENFSRYSHPAYGMVEECSWKMDCVKQWDSNTTAFSSLPKEQQQQLITDHENYWKEDAVKEREAAKEREAKEKEEREKQMDKEKEAKDKELAKEKESKEKEVAQEKEAKEKELAKEKDAAKEREGQAKQR
jgi:mannosyltransferase OCH1-like enzyme